MRAFARYVAARAEGRHMTWKQQDLDNLNEAIASGAMSVAYEGKSVTYRSVDEMLRIRAMIEKELGLGGTSRTILPQHSRG
jgi:hypothetical protein